MLEQEDNFIIAGVQFFKTGLKRTRILQKKKGREKKEGVFPRFGTRWGLDYT